MPDDRSVVTFTSVPLYQLRKSGVNGGPQSRSRHLGEKSTVRAINLMCGICVELIGVCYEKFKSVDIFYKQKYRN